MLELDEPTLSFEPDKLVLNEGIITRNFFDINSRKICTIRNNGNLGLTVKTLGQTDVLNVRTKDRGEPLTVKFSPNGALCVVHRTSATVDVIFLEKTVLNVCLELPVTSKRKESLLCVEWTSDTQLLLVTNNTIEIVTINMEKRTWKQTRSMNVSAIWTYYYCPSNLLLVSNGQFCANLQPIIIANSQFVRLKSVEADFSPSSSKENLLEKDLTIATIYGTIYLMVLRYNTRNASVTDLAMYAVPEDVHTEPYLKYNLILGLSGGCGVHVVDNLVVVHHQASRQSLIFDIGGTGGGKSTVLPLATTSIGASSRLNHVPEMYSPYWFTFPDNTIIDSRDGMVFSLTVRNELAKDHIVEKGLLLEYLSRRKSEKCLFLKTLLECLIAKEVTLRRTRKIFHFIAKNMETEKAEITPSKKALNVKPHKFVSISQQEMLSAIFIPMKEESPTEPSYLCNVMLQYLRALFDCSCQVEAYFLEVLVQSLVVAREMSKLHQLVTYGVISDSKPLAFLFLSLKLDVESPLVQCGIDVLARNKCPEEIVDILLQNGQIVSALRFIDSKNLGEPLLNKVVEASSECSRSTKEAINEFMSERKLKTKTKLNPIFPEDEKEQAKKEVASFVSFEF